MKLRTQIFLLLFMFGLLPLLVAFMINMPMIFDRFEALYQKAHLQNLRAEFGDLDQHLARRHEMARLLAKIPEPGLLLSGNDAEPVAGLEAARTAYVGWVNQVLIDQLDITRIFYLDVEGNVVFTLDRDYSNGRFEIVTGDDGKPEPGLHLAARQMSPGSVMNGPIVFDHEAAAVAPNRFMQMGMVSPVFFPQVSTDVADVTGPQGSVIMYLDMGGLAHAYRGNYWVLDNGQYLESTDGESSEVSAFDDFDGLADIFAKRELALWKFGNQQVLWVPLFTTVGEGTLWVGRSVDASPLAILRNKVELIVIAIVISLLALVFLVARLIAVRSERLGHELTDGITRVLEHDEAVSFSWKRPEELNELGNKLTRLAETHTAHNKALMTHAEELEASNRYKSEFLANVSHELRTPLNSILLLSKMLSDSSIPGMPEEACRRADVIHAAGKDLKALIDNILDLSRLEARQMTLVSEPVDLRKLLDGVTELMRPQFEEKHLGLDVEIDPAIPGSLRSDGEKIRQILLNFLSNAVKFTERGGILVRLAPGTDSNGVQYPVGISVADTGIGIEPGKHELVFEAFKQADGSTNRRFGGTGLGLAISRELASLMGGDIELKSDSGSGSTFTLFLPLEMPDLYTVEDSHGASVDNNAGKPGDSVSVPVADYNGARVLLVDDDMRSLLAMTPLLERWQLDVMAAGDGEEALETLESEDAFRLMFVDIIMPGMDGYEFIRRIRQQPAFSDVPVVALLTSESDEDRERCHAAGADDCLVKPVDPHAMKQLIDRYLTVAAGAGAAGNA